MVLRWAELLLLLLDMAFCIRRGEHYIILRCSCKRPVSSVLEAWLCITNVLGNTMLLAFRRIAFVASLGEWESIWLEFWFLHCKGAGLEIIRKFKSFESSFIVPSFICLSD